MNQFKVSNNQSDALYMLNIIYFPNYVLESHIKRISRERSAVIDLCLNIRLNVEDMYNENLYRCIDFQDKPF